MNVLRVYINGRKQGVYLNGKRTTEDKLFSKEFLKTKSCFTTRVKEKDGKEITHQRYMVH